MTVRAAAIQLCSGSDPEANARMVTDLVRQAADKGAQYIQTPEVTNLVTLDRSQSETLARTEEDDFSLAALRTVAADKGVTVHIGSLSIRDGDRLANRSFVIAPDGSIAARYDKIHMFDVDLPDGETFRESQTFAPGRTAHLTPIGPLMLGLTICFDVRFAKLYAGLAEAGATMFSVPAAFAVSTGEAHWHTLLKARAIENGAFVVAAAQGGTHDCGRTTYGHSLIIDPWGRILAEGTDVPDIIMADLDPAMVETVRRQVPIMTARRTFSVVPAGTPQLRSAS
ncbi:MAG: carbon-nitrogen hydrolase family protein [Pseudomonadota bacterium]